MPASACPNGKTCTTCPEHAEGLAAYARDRNAYDRALDRARPTRLRIVTLGPRTADDCDGTMTCSCSRCAKDRASRPALGAGPAQFKPRPARRRAA